MLPQIQTPKLTAKPIHISNCRPSGGKENAPPRLQTCRSGALDSFPEFSFSLKLSFKRQISMIDPQIRKTSEGSDERTREAF
jgi:hypothetical protein